MSTAGRDLTPAGWHQALAFAVCGAVVEGLDSPATPQIAVLISQLRKRIGVEALRAHRDEMVAAECPWPHPVPAELRAGLGAAQFAAALRELQVGLGLTDYHLTAPAPARALTADEQRLLLDVPPHHGV